MGVSVCATAIGSSLEAVERIANNVLQLPDFLIGDPSSPGFGFFHDEDTSLQPDGKTQLLGSRRVFAGNVRTRMASISAKLKRRTIGPGTERYSQSLSYLLIHGSPVISSHCAYASFQIASISTSYTAATSMLIFRASVIIA